MNDYANGAAYFFDNKIEIITSNSNKILHIFETDKIEKINNISAYSWEINSLNTPYL